MTIDIETTEKIQAIGDIIYEVDRKERTVLSPASHDQLMKALDEITKIIETSGHQLGD